MPPRRRQVLPPIAGAIAGFVVAEMAAGSLFGAAGLDLRAFPVAVILAGLMGAAAPYLWLRHSHSPQCKSTQR